MDFYERIAEAFDRLKVNRAQVGRETGMSGQAVTQKLKRKSAITMAEIEVYARHAQMSVAEALGGGVVIEDKKTQQLVEHYHRMTPEDRAILEGFAASRAAQSSAAAPEAESPPG